MSGNGSKKGGDRTNVKYQPIKADDNHCPGETDKTPLLGAMESTERDQNTDKNAKDEIDNVDKVDSSLEESPTEAEGINKPKNCSNGDIPKSDDNNVDKACDAINEVSIDDGVKSVESQTGKTGVPENDNVTELSKNVIISSNKQGAKPKRTMIKASSEQTITMSTIDSEHHELDIVRKMSEPGTKLHSPWQLLGTYFELKQKPCRRLYAQSGRSDDLALFFNNGKFYAMEAWCTHMGKSS